MVYLHTFESQGQSKLKSGVDGLAPTPVFVDDGPISHASGTRRPLKGTEGELPLFWPPSSSSEDVEVPSTGRFLAAHRTWSEHGSFAGCTKGEVNGLSQKHCRAEWF